jgi:glycosyltransferase involved in cell wall biosynthesis
LCYGLAVAIGPAGEVKRLGISAIIAAYNEEKTIAEVLTVLTRNPLIDEVIVVSDGSSDATVEISRSFDVTTIALRENRGKGYAMRVGVGPIRNFFHLQMKVGPVLSGIRVMRREVWETVPLRYQERFKIEAGLNFFCSQAGFRQQQTTIYNLGHLIKETKRGLLPGLSARWEMSREVFLLHFDLYVFATWQSDMAEQTAPLPVTEYDLFE